MPRTSSDSFDVAVIGGGILGLAHAWMAAECGQRVVVFERDTRAAGASVRNFGMVWPIGQPDGELRQLAMRSREHWLQLGERSGLWVNACGSIHLARHEDEQAILEEFVAGVDQASGVCLLTANEVAAKSPAARTDGLLAGLWSDSELCVNPRTASQHLKEWLVATFPVEAQFETTIVAVQDHQITTSTNRKYQADRIVICSGSDFETLFPAEFERAGLIKCKLQMLATNAQPDQWKLGPHLAGGLTLRHYRSFDCCPSVARLRQRIQQEKPSLDQFGIHVMASQNDQGEIILGDSHLYGQDITPFDCSRIDELILSEIRQLICVPNLEISRRWHGIYAKHPSQHIVVMQPSDNCRIVAAPGGAGMTFAFGIAEQTWKGW